MESRSHSKKNSLSRKVIREAKLLSLMSRNKLKFHKMKKVMTILIYCENKGLTVDIQKIQREVEESMDHDPNIKNDRPSEPGEIVV